MRDIKFRCKNKSGNWCFFTVLHSGNVNEENFDLETLSQSTGMLDKQGVEIYEGDIIKSICVVDMNTTEEYIGVVEYPKDDCGFYLIVKKITGKNGTINSNYYTALKHHTNEVIGSIYEDSDLL